MRKAEFRQHYTDSVKVITCRTGNLRFPACISHLSADLGCNETAESACAVQANLHALHRLVGDLTGPEWER